MGRCCFSQRRYGEALTRFEEQARWARLCAEDRAEAECVALHNVGMARVYAGERKDGLEALESASRRDVDVPLQVARTEALIGLVHLLEGRYDEAADLGPRVTRKGASASRTNAGNKGPFLQPFVRPCATLPVTPGQRSSSPGVRVIVVVRSS